MVRDLSEGGGDVHGGVAVEVDARQADHPQHVVGEFFREQELLDGGTALDILFKGLVQSLGLERVIVLDPAGIAVEVVHREAQLLVVEIRQVGRTGGPGHEGLVVVGVDFRELDFVDRQVGHHFLAVEAGVVVIEVRVHVRERGEGEVDRTLAVGVEVDAVGTHIERRGRLEREVGDALVADERHAVIIDIGHAGLQEAHLVRKCLEPVGHEHVVVDIDSRRRIGVGQGVLARASVRDGHRGAGQDDGLEVRRRDVGDIRHAVIEAERHLPVRGDLGDHGHDPLGVAAPVGHLVRNAVPVGVVLRAAGNGGQRGRQQQKGEDSGFHTFYRLFVY